MPIIIENVSIADSDELESTYHLLINREFVAEFKHARASGLAECLKAASEAATLAETEKQLQLYTIVKDVFAA